MAQVEDVAAKDVLLVVPDGDTARRISQAIGDAGYRAVVAPDVDAARQLLAADLAPCVILLYLSPRDGAAGFLEDVRRAPGGALVPVVMFSTGTAYPLPAPMAPLFSTLLHLVEQHCAT